MSDIRITDSFIYNYIDNAQLFQKGTLYYLNNRVRDFFFDRNTHRISATLIGTEYEYDVCISFNADGQILTSGCTCSYFFSVGEPCEHIAAVLKAAQKELPKSRNYPHLNQKAVNNIFNYFSNLYEDNKRDQINLVLTYNYDREFGMNTSSIELRLGKDRLYKVKNIKDFMTAIDKQQSIIFGKGFIFDPAIHSFSVNSQKILDFIREVYENEHLLKSSISGFYQTGSLFKGKKVYLSETSINRLFSILEGQRFDAYILGSEILDIEIIKADIPVDLALNEEDSNLALSLNSKELIMPLTSSGSYCYFEGKIYHPSSLQQKYLTVFLNGFINNPGKKIVFSPSEKERFVSEVLPFAQQIASVVIDEELTQSFYKVEMLARVYFDKHEEGICARVEFVYGEEIINPFAPKRNKEEQKKIILIRDPLKERELLQIFEDADFKVEKEIVYLSDEEKIFSFLYGTLPSLQELAEVYYSEAFKNMRIKENYSFSAGVRLNESTNMLEFSFHIENIDSSELEHIFATLREKKKYYRLKDGSFLPLDIPQLETMSELVEQLDITGYNLSETVISLPSYRAAFIDNLMREGNLLNIERNLAFKQMVQNIREPQDMEYHIPEELQNVASQIRCQFLSSKMSNLC